MRAFGNILGKVGMAAIAMSAAATTWATEPNLVTGGMAWAFAPRPVEVPDTPARAPLGELLFEQSLSPAVEVRPDPEATGQLSGWFSNKTPVSLRTLRFALTIGGVNGVTYCSVVGPKSATQRLCLIDVDDDGVFDFQGRAFALGNGAQFASMLLAANVVPSSISYEKVEKAGPPLLRAGLVIRKKKNSYVAGFAVDNGKRPKELERYVEQGGFLRKRRVQPPGAEFDTSQLPIVVGLYGAEIEILAIEGKEVVYRVLSPFTSDEVIPVAHAGSFQ